MASPGGAGALRSPKASTCTIVGSDLLKFHLMAKYVMHVFGGKTAENVAALVDPATTVKSVLIMFLFFICRSAQR